MARVVSLIVLVAIIVLIAILFFRVMATFIVPLFLAAVLVVVFTPLHDWITTRLNGRYRIAALITSLLIALSVLVPVGCVVTLAAMEGFALAADLDDMEFRERYDRLRSSLGLSSPHGETLQRMREALDGLVRRPTQEVLIEEEAVAEVTRNVLERLSHLEVQLQSQMTPQLEEAIEQLRQRLLKLQYIEEPGGVEYDRQLKRAIDRFEDLKVMLLGGRLRAYLYDLSNLSDEEFTALSEQTLAAVTRWLLPMAGATTALILKVIIGVVILLVAVYYFLADGPGMIRTTMRLVPLDDRYERELLGEFAQISRAVVVATLLSAIVQGLLAGIGYAAAGLNSVFLLILLTTVLAMIPFLGAAAVWVPASLWLYISEERMWAALLLALYGAGVVSLVDNIIKPFVLHGQSHLHPLLALLSVLGGVQALGPIGIVVGPMSVAFLQTLLNILHREITSMERTALTAK